MGVFVTITEDPKLELFDSDFFSLELGEAAFEGTLASRGVVSVTLLGR